MSHARPSNEERLHKATVEYLTEHPLGPLSFFGNGGPAAVKKMQDALIELNKNGKPLEKAFIIQHKMALLGGDERRSTFEPLLNNIGFGDIVKAWHKAEEKKAAAGITPGIG